MASTSLSWSAILHALILINHPLRPVRHRLAIPMRLARQAADLAAASLMVHVTNAPRPLPEILSSMRPGDIITHCLHRYQYGIMGPTQERILDEVWRARQAGIIFDYAHGRMHFYLPLIRKAIAHGFLPDPIATDLTLPNAPAWPRTQSADRHVKVPQHGGAAGGDYRAHHDESRPRHW